MHSNATTNQKLEQVLTELDRLIQWAKADAEHAEENDAPDTAADDRLRAKLLTDAWDLVSGCGR